MSEEKAIALKKVLEKYEPRVNYHIINFNVSIFLSCRNCHGHVSHVIYGVVFCDV